MKDKTLIAYKIAKKTLNKIALTKCTCEVKFPCPGAMAATAMWQMDEALGIKPKKSRKK